MDTSPIWNLSHFSSEHIKGDLFQNPALGLCSSLLGPSPHIAQRYQGPRTPSDPSRPHKPPPAPSPFLLMDYEKVEKHHHFRHQLTEFLLLLFFLRVKINGDVLPK